MKKVYIVSAKRSAIGSFLGSLKNEHPSNIGASVVKGLLNHANLDATKVDELICGNVLGANLGQGIARQISLKAGMLETSCAHALNMICGSGLKSILSGYNSIIAGDNEIVIAGGVESMSYAPLLFPNTVRNGNKMGDIKVVDHMIYDALTDAFEGYHMGITAENIVDKHNISRSEQDEFAINSQMKAIKADDANKFVDEIVPYEIVTKKETIVFDRDEYINRKTNLEKLSGLRPAFKKDGSVTAGNSSGINDGASFVLLASEDACKENNLKPLFEIISTGQAGVDHKVMGLGPVGAIRKALKKANLKLEDMDLVELNEAFAAQSLGVIKELVQEHNIDRDTFLSKVNVNGGAIALGHPVGASGNRIVVTLLHEMLKTNATYGLASLCIGGGLGTAVVVKKV